MGVFKILSIAVVLVSVHFVAIQAQEEPGSGSGSGSGSGVGEESTAPPTTTTPHCTLQCGLNTICNLNGDSFPTCDCDTGHKRSSENPADCVAIDNCVDTEPCGTFSTCTPTGPATHTCVCLEGYISDNEDQSNCFLRVRVVTKDNNLHLVTKDLFVDTPRENGTLMSASFLEIVKATVDNKAEIDSNHAAINQLLSESSDALSAEIDSVEAEFAQFKDDTEENFGAFSTRIDDSIATINSDIQTVQDNVDTNIDDIAANTRDIDDLTSDLSTLEQVQSTDKAALEASITAAAATAARELSSAKGDLETQIGGVSATVTANKQETDDQLDEVFDRLKNYPPPDFESDLITLRAQQGAGSYTEVRHNLGVRPDRVIAVVTFVGLGGSNAKHNNFFFTSSGGSATVDDDASRNPDAGFVMAYSATTVRMWAPSRNNGGRNSYLVHNCNGWGEERNCVNGATTLGATRVRVFAWKNMIPGVIPSIKSTTIQARGARNSGRSYKTLSDFPKRFEWHDVMCSIERSGFRHDGRGLAPIDNDGPQYGGLLYGYKPETGQVKLWAAGNGGSSTSTDNRRAQLIFANDGWSGRNEFSMTSGTAFCSVWADGPSPTYDSGWVYMNTQKTNGGVAYMERTFPTADGGRHPRKVKVQVRVRSGTFAGYIFDAIGTGNVNDNHSGQSYNTYAGVLYGYSPNTVRVWVPERNTGHNSGYIFYIADGWGGGEGNFAYRDADVRILVWH